MTLTYTEKKTNNGWEYIELIDDSKPDSITYIPKDLQNPLYQSYLNPIEQSAEISTNE